MKFFFKLVFVVLVAGVIAAVVGSIVSKKKLESMSDDEIREFLGVKLAGKVGDDQLVTIQEAVISGVRGKKPTVDHYIEDVEEAMDDLDQVTEDAAEEAADAVHDATETVTDTVETATE